MVVSKSWRSQEEQKIKEQSKNKGNCKKKDVLHKHKWQALKKSVNHKSELLQGARLTSEKCQVKRHMGNKMNLEATI